jgi:hypothetical protein
MHTTTKRLLLAATLATAGLVPAVAGGQSEPSQQITPPTAAATPTLIDHRCPRGRLSVKAYRAYASRAYGRRSVGRAAHRRLAYMRKCQHSRWATREVARYRARFKRERLERRRSQACTPYGRWAIPPYIVMRESHGQNVPNASGSDASGYYQMLDSTFHGAGGPDLPGRYDAMHSPKGVQDCAADRLWAGGAGSGHWALTR